MFKVEQGAVACSDATCYVKCTCKNSTTGTLGRDYTIAVSNRAYAAGPAGASASSPKQVYCAKPCTYTTSTTTSGSECPFDYNDPNVLPGTSTCPQYFMYTSATLTTTTTHTSTMSGCNSYTTTSTSYCSACIPVPPCKVQAKAEFGRIYVRCSETCGYPNIRVTGSVRGVGTSGGECYLSVNEIVNATCNDSWQDTYRSIYDGAGYCSPQSGSLSAKVVNMPSNVPEGTY